MGGVCRDRTIKNQTRDVCSIHERLHILRTPADKGDLQYLLINGNICNGCLPRLVIIQKVHHQIALTWHKSLYSTTSGKRYTWSLHSHSTPQITAADSTVLPALQLGAAKQDTNMPPCHQGGNHSRLGDLQHCL